MGQLHHHGSEERVLTAGLDEFWRMWFALAHGLINLMARRASTTIGTKRSEERVRFVDVASGVVSGNEASPVSKRLKVLDESAGRKEVYGNQHS